LSKYNRPVILERPVTFADVALRPLGILGVLVVLGASAAGTNAAEPISYTFTIYADEGRGAVSGHVFVRLSDGKNNLYRGFYPQQARTDTFGREIGPLGLGGGEIRDDVHHQWDVRQSYDISKDDFRNALQLITEVGNQHGSWCLTNHCGDFALAVARAAGVHLDLPQNTALGDRPGVVVQYLKQHGGVTREEDVASCTADVNARAAAGETAFQHCGACTAADVQQHIAQLHVLRDNQLKACAAIGL
jgi:hypothetical protein